MAMGLVMHVKVMQAPSGEDQINKTNGELFFAIFFSLFVPGQICSLPEINVKVTTPPHKVLSGRIYEMTY